MNVKSNTQTRSGSRRRKKTRLRTIVTAIQVVILIGISASVGVGLGTFVNLSNMLPTIGDIEAPEATIVYSSDGVVLARIFREDRTNVALDEIPKSLRDATIAIEDKRFYHHSGVDMRGILRSVWANLRGQRMAQGGSTITQQLARNVYLSQRKTLERKVQEAVLAILIERNFTKKQILELYLNRVYYGSGAFGVQAASKVYFGKDVEQLSLSECALLAGLPKKPSGYSPHEDKEAAIGRRNVVLKQLEDLGYITSEERQEAKSERIRVIPRVRGRMAIKAPHFVDYVTKQLKDRYGDDVLFSGGLRVYTTLNYEMQQIAEDALRKDVRKHENSRKVTEGCFIAVEATNGYVRAMVGSVDPASQFNRTTQGQGRQPGSAFKPFVYTAAFAEGGMKPSDRVIDGPVSYPGGAGKEWKPRNYDDKFHGSVTIKYAIAKSINIPAIKTAESVGINNVIKYAKLLGIKSELEPYLSIAIGGVKGIHPIEMASAYATFANGGTYIEPCSIIRITNSKGKVLEDYRPEGKRVISEQVCDMIDECLRSVVTSGTGTKAGGVRNARGKTGTTNDDRDAWFVGYVPNKLSAACWVGNDNYAPMRKAYGGQVCAPVWKDFMEKSIPILDNVRKKQNDPSVFSSNGSNNKTNNSNNKKQTNNSDVVRLKICDVSGDIAGTNCPAWHTKRFIKGTEPTANCAVHGSQNPDSVGTNEQNTPAPPNSGNYVEVEICSDSGMIAGSACPNPVHKRVLVEDVPSRVCNIHNSASQ